MSTMNIDYEKMTVGRLRETMRGRNLDYKGLKKVDLVKALLDDDASSDRPPWEDTQPSDELAQPMEQPAAELEEEPTLAVVTDDYAPTRPEIEDDPDSWGFKTAARAIKVRDRVSALMEYIAIQDMGGHDSVRDDCTNVLRQCKDGMEGVIKALRVVPVGIPETPRKRGANGGGKRELEELAKCVVRKKYRERYELPLVVNGFDSDEKRREAFENATYVRMHNKRDCWVNLGGNLTIMPRGHVRAK